MATAREAVARGGGGGPSGGGGVDSAGGFPVPRSLQLQGLPRQGSIYSLTLDEFQNAINSEQGKSFGSMNMSEFLENVWTAEESAAMGALGHQQLQGGALGGGLMRQPSLNRQGSLNIPRTVAAKTVDEVWKEIHQNNAQREQAQVPKAQGTFGEMTLEDFLRKAGVVGDDLDLGPQHVSEQHQHQAAAAVMNANAVLQAQALSQLGVRGPQHVQALNAAQQQAEWMNYQLKNFPAALAQQQLQQQQQVLQQQQQLALVQAQQQALALPPPSLPTPLGRLPPRPALPPVITANGGDSPGTDSGSPGTSPRNELENGAGEPSPAGERRGKKRALQPDEQGKGVERRQRRMIKNRESAARSRARKQAYTQELEAEVSALKEENQKLKKQQALMQILEVPAPPAAKLRRTKTGPW